MTHIKYIPIIAGAISSTSALFFLMHSLVAHDEAIIVDEEPTRFFDYVQEDILDPKPREIERIEKPVPVEDEPTPVDPPPSGTGDFPTRLPPPPNPPKPSGDINLGLNSLQDGQEIPLVTVQPQYPRRPQEKEIEGWATVAFTIDEFGAVIDPYIVEAEPKGYFERATLKAIQKFKYKPKVVNGVAVASSGSFRMTFTMNN